MDNVTPAEAVSLSSSPPVPTSSSPMSSWSPSSSSSWDRSSPRSGSSQDRTPVWRPLPLAPVMSSSSPLSSPPPFQQLDHSAFPHILNAILAAAPRSTLLLFRETCRELCARIDAQLGKILVLEQMQVPVGGRSGPRPSRVGSDGDSDMEEAGAALPETRHLAVVITDPDGRRIPALPSGTYHTVSVRQAAALSRARVVTLRGVATPHAFATLVQAMVSVHTLHYRARGYSGPLPRSRVVVPIPQPHGPTMQLSRWSLGPARSETLVLLVPLSHMGSGFVLHASAHRQVIMILTPQEVSLAAMGFFSASEADQSPTPSPYPSAPSSPVPWARPPAALAPQQAAPLGILRHIVRNMARTIGQTRFTIVGLELVDPARCAFPTSMHVTSEDLQRHVVQAVIHQAWRGDWYGPADEMERSVNDRIEFVTHEEYERRVGAEQYVLETRL